MKRWTSRALAFWGALWIVWQAYACAAPEPADKLPSVVTATAEDFDLPATLAAHLGVSVTEGNQVTLLLNGNEIFPPMLAAIEAAEESVNFLTYVYWTGEIANDFAEALATAATRGVEVRVLLDAYGAHKVGSELIDAMEAAGCTIAWYHPFNAYNVRRINNRTHRKVLVVDGSIAFTGGVGIASEWMGDAEGPDEWRDNHFAVLGPIVTYLQGAFSENWLEATGEVLGGARFFPPSEAVGPTRAIPLLASPRRDMSPIAFSYWIAMHHAVERVDIATPYFVPDESLLDAMAATARRGVRVRLMVPGPYNDSNLVRWASLSRYPALLEAGVEIYEFQPTMLHTKSLMVDDRWSVIGSANFDNRSFELNDEIQVFVEDATLNRQLTHSFEQDLARSERVSRDDFQGLAWPKRMAGWAALLLREQL